MFFILVLVGQAFGTEEIKIIINKKVNKLAYIKNGSVVKIMPVATGRSPGLTPEGKFKVVRKLVNPYYSKKKIPGGSPRNPLGVRWLGLNALNTPGNTYGIHGTNNPKSIGKYASGGCIRMYNKDAIWLYENTPLYTPVEIINKPWDLEPKPISIIVNGRKLQMDKSGQPYMVNDRVMIPCRVVAESMGCSLAWDDKKREVTIRNGAVEVKATVNSKAVYVNNVLKYIDVPTAYKNNRVYLPVRALADSFGYTVTWNNSTYTVTMTKGVTANGDATVPPAPPAPGNVVDVPSANTGEEGNGGLTPTGPQSEQDGPEETVDDTTDAPLTE